MTDAEKIAWVRTLLQDDPQATDAVITGYLTMAGDRIAHAAYPLAGDTAALTMPVKYDGIQCELAARYFSRRGGLGESEHSENGIGRKWESATDTDLLNQITPYAKVV